MKTVKELWNRFCLYLGLREECLSFDIGEKELLADLNYGRD